MDVLWSELDLLIDRYGKRAVTIPPELERLQMADRRRTQVIAHLRSNIEEMVGEITRLEQERQGIALGTRALLEDTIERIRTERGEGWSPLPVVGYRLWALSNDSLVGARHPWPAPALSATCGMGLDGEIPHSDGSCGRLGCGIYAVTDLGSLLSEHLGTGSTGYGAGRVELSGKVVEHDKGYRAAHARVVALVVVGGTGWFAATDPDLIADAFEDPQRALETHGRPDPPPTNAQLIDLLTTEEQTWTSADSDG